MRGRQLFLNVLMAPVGMLHEFAVAWPDLPRGTRAWVGPVALAIAPLAVPGALLVGALVAYDHVRDR